ncbi:5'-3' exonuclease PLD3-like [Glandiceps talaboti]
METNDPLLLNDDSETKKPRSHFIVLYLALTLINIAIVAVSIIIYLQGDNCHHGIPTPPSPCTDPCVITLVESIPDNLTYEKGFTRHLSTYEGWMNLLDLAEDSIDIASFYWTLRGDDVIPDPSDWQGENIYAGLLNAGTERGIDIRIAQSQPTNMNPSQDTIDLVKAGAARVRSLNFTRFMSTHDGILHTKMWVVDGQHFYVGSANLDWRSLTQVKELGALVQNCSCLAQDMTKIFETYWYMGDSKSTLPSPWPSSYNTPYNITTPMEVKFNKTNTTTFLANSPPEFCAYGRSSDIDTILHVIDSAEQFVSIAVMEYFPAIIYKNPRSYWSIIDDKLRSVAYNKHVIVRLLASKWNHTEPEMYNFLQSLASLDGAVKGGIEVKLFVVPDVTESQRKIPYARVNHNKYMITDKAAYIGTSNWSGDYFVDTGGIGFVVNQTTAEGDKTFQKQLLNVFERDWYSEHAKPLSSIQW